MADPHNDEVLTAIDERSSAVVEGTVAPYWGVVEMMGALSDELDEHTDASLYLLFAELTDWYELHESERPVAESTMRDAAADWLERGRADVPAFVARWDRARTRAASSEDRGNSLG